MLINRLQFFKTGNSPKKINIATMTRIKYLWMQNFKLQWLTEWIYQQQQQQLQQQLLLLTETTTTCLIANKWKW